MRSRSYDIYSRYEDLSLVLVNTFFLNSNTGFGEFVTHPASESGRVAGIIWRLLIEWFAVHFRVSLINPGLVARIYPHLSSAAPSTSRCPSSIFNSILNSCCFFSCPVSIWCCWLFWQGRRYCWAKQLSNEGKSDLGLLLIDRLAHEFGVAETPSLSFQSPNDRKNICFYLSRYITIFNMSVGSMATLDTCR